MAHHPKLVVRRADSRTMDRLSSATATGRMPDELVDDQIRRLALFSVVGAGLWTFGLVLNLVLLPSVVAAAVPSRVAFVIELSGVLSSLLMFSYVKLVAHSPEVKRSVGLVYFVLSAFGVALLNTWVSVPDMAPPQFLSWITIVILVFAMIAPAPPRQLLVASLIAASMDPFGTWLAYLRGTPVPSAACAT